MPTLAHYQTLKLAETNAVATISAKLGETPLGTNGLSASSICCVRSGLIPDSSGMNTRWNPKIGSRVSGHRLCAQDVVNRQVFKAERLSYLPIDHLSVRHIESFAERQTLSACLLPALLGQMNSVR